jgi:sulfatase modifying factor 1
MIFVEGDTFQMGNDFKKGKGDEKPLHIVSVDDYYMSKYEITQSQWIEIMRYNPSKFKGENKPIGRVKWIEAIEYCNKLSEFEGLEKCYLGNKLNIVCDFTASGYRLPTEAEWEFAARGGVKSIGYKYSGSDDIQNVGWYGDNSERELHDVGKKKSNELGICDMSGNIHEWCWDWYDDDYYKNSSNDNPIGPELGKIRVMRGGYWSNNEFNCRVSSRFNYSPDGSKGSGFRVVRRP